jgi:hypothetical protein
VGEFEALSALAGYAREHPADELPEFVEQRGYFEAVGLYSWISSGAGRSESPRFREEFLHLGMRAAVDQVL